MGFRPLSNTPYFTYYTLSWQRGKGGRKCRGTKIASSLGSYWKVYRLVYERAMGVKQDGEMNQSMHKVLRPAFCLNFICLSSLILTTDEV